MNTRTFQKRLQTLSSEVYRHPNADELLNIMSQQLADDTSGQSQPPKEDGASDRPMEGPTDG